MSGLAQLEELVFRCGNEQSRRYIAEAVACYNGGAYRACILTTWIATVVDIMAKLRQLEMTGDAAAGATLAKVASFLENGNMSAALQFEREILDKARDVFALISNLEHEDLKRLQDDRNRCAHPSMSSDDESYAPSAELARYHLRNAVEYVLQRPPVQGKAALEGLMRQVHAEYFPTAVDKVVEALQAGPLARPRDALVRNFLLLLIKELLRGEISLDAGTCLAAAVNAVRKMHPRVSEVTLGDTLPDVIRSVADESIRRVVWFLFHVDDTWQYLGNDCRARVERYVSEMPNDELWHYLPLALGVAPLGVEAESRLTTVDGISLAKLAKDDPYGHRGAYLSRALALWEHSGSFKTTDKLTDVLVLGVDLLTETDVNSLLVKAKGNWQITKTFNLERLVNAVLDGGVVSKEAITELIRQHEMDWLLDSFEN